ncbi:receptor for retinol uptake STRA6 isoform X1 [Phascolarctos cinereus]|nr:stimulated by retinoic acid gene 6 protein homolog isoform X2 [Phascolarctos cinereus]XP_020850355.1 stimulated by retinoic acid gene 6 protein homolog isoform X2 [Phascolarctos cinereus]
MSSLASANQSSGEPEDYSYGNWYIDEPTSGGDASQPDKAILACQHSFPPSLYHTCLAPLSLATILLLSLLVKRRKLCLGCWHGTFGLPSPWDFLAEESGRLVPVAVFGILFTNLCVLGLDDDPLPFVPISSPAGQGYWKTLALLYYPALYYPLIACATVQHQAGYILGCLLSWAHCGVQIWHKVECPETAKVYRYYSLLVSLPLLSGLVLLSLWYPVQLLRCWSGKTAPAGPEVVEESYYGDYLRHVLSGKRSKGSFTVTNPNFASRVLFCFLSYIYIPQRGFRLPLKLILSATLAAITIYQEALLFLVAFVPILQKARAGITEEVTYLLAGFGLVLSEDKLEVIELVKYYLWALEVCYVSALVLSCLLTFLMLTRSMVTHRANLRARHCGAAPDGGPKPQRQGVSATAIFCWMSFSGYQTAFVCLGLFLQQVVFFLGFVVFTFLVIIPILYSRNLLLFRMLESMWPFWLTLVLAVIVQNLAARWAFLESHHDQRELTNRKALYSITFLLFPINVLVGIIVGICRMAISTLFNVIHFCQMDLSFLCHGVDTLDPGYRTYCYYLKMEVSQSHPAMRAFCFLLLQSPGSRGLAGAQAVLRPSDVEEGIHLLQTKNPARNTTKSKQSRVRWGLAYTLIRNPSLLAFRKKTLAGPLANGNQPNPSKP